METNLLPILLVGALIAFLMNQWTFVLMGDLVSIGVLAAAGFDKTLYLSVLVITALNYFLVLLLEKVCVLYGRRRIGAHMLLSIALFFVATLLVPGLGVYQSGIGLALSLVPGLLANDCYDQGLLKTLGLCGLFTALLLFLSRLI